MTSIFACLVLVGAAPPPFANPRPRYRSAAMRLALPLAASALFACCSAPRFAASRAVDYEIPVVSVQRLACETRNGGITVVGDPTAQVVRLHAEFTARAGSQDDANALLNQLDVKIDVNDGFMDAKEIGPDGGWTTSTSCSFTITLPVSTPVSLVSHNGDVRVTGTQGDVRAESHNGEVTADTAAASVAAVTHNGNVHLSLRGELREATVESHNGEVVVECDAPARAAVDLATHNGSIRCPDGMRDATSGKGWLKGRLGDGKGTLLVKTHNGDIVLR